MNEYSPQVGDLVWDGEALKVGEVMDRVGTRWQLRPPGGGREWDASGPLRHRRDCRQAWPWPTPGAGERHLERADDRHPAAVGGMHARPAAGLHGSTPWVHPDRGRTSAPLVRHPPGTAVRLLLPRHEAVAPKARNPTDVPPGRAPSRVTTDSPPLSEAAVTVLCMSGMLPSPCPRSTRVHTATAPLVIRLDRERSAYHGPHPLSVTTVPA